ncbi:MAG: plasmid stabilization protein [Thermodesulfobacteriota bacterium]|nr:plasmid stabilization protein [Thermodesulfobacteriota bacterium]
MESLTIRNLDPVVKHELRLQAARHACSMEEEARRILRAAVIKTDKEKGIGTWIHQQFSKTGGFDLKVTRTVPRELNLFDGE